MRTPLCDRLGIEFPIFAFSHCRDVIAAVSKAGGFGVLGAAGFSPAQLEVELDWIDEHVGDKPYGVDIIVPAKYTGVEQGGMTRKELAGLIPDEHRRFVDELMRKYGVEELPDDEDGRQRRRHRRPRGRRRDGDVARERAAAARHGVGPPEGASWSPTPSGRRPTSSSPRRHERGVLVAGLVGTVVHAERQQAAGVDMIIAQGSEAGGHTGEIGTMVLVPQVVDAVAPLPVLAAGGIADGRQIAAALALGAQGVWCGSVWLTTEEAETHPVVKEKFLAATSSDTLRSRSKTGKPPASCARRGPTSGTTRPTPIRSACRCSRCSSARPSGGSPARRRRNDGSRQLINYFVGQAVGMMNESKPAARRSCSTSSTSTSTPPGGIAATIADD